MAGKPKRTDIDFNEFRKLLVARRDRLQNLHKTQRTLMAEEDADASENELSRVSTFDSAENADGGAVAADDLREELGDQNIVDILEEVNRALERLDDGTYGLDIQTGESIPVARLRALPWATMTVENAAAHE